MNNNPTGFYREFGYLVIRNFLPEREALDLADRMRVAQMSEQSQDGEYFRDTQVPLAYSRGGVYNDLLDRFLPVFTNLMEVPRLCTVSSYARIYEHGAELRGHQDRPELQHSATICLSRDTTVWEFCLYDLKGNLVKVSQAAGDALLYRGKLVHWREGSYQGHEQIQAFLHYYDSSIFSTLMISTARIFYHKKIRWGIKVLSGRYSKHFTHFGRLLRKQSRRWWDSEI
jgi:hypothetical protein